MSRPCTNPKGICTRECSKKNICTIPRRSVLQYFVATHPERGVYVDSVMSGVALRRAELLSEVPEASDKKYGTGYRPGIVRIFKGML